MIRLLTSLFAFGVLVSTAHAGCSKPSGTYTGTMSTSVFTSDDPTLEYKVEMQYRMYIRDGAWTSEAYLGSIMLRGGTQPTLATKSKGVQLKTGISKQSGSSNWPAIGSAGNSFSTKKCRGTIDFGEGSEPFRRLSYTVNDKENRIEFMWLQTDTTYPFGDFVVYRVDAQ